jgi:hypothetical protein
VKLRYVAWKTENGAKNLLGSATLEVKMMLQFDFSHRPQPNGSYDSICTRCFATVARSHNEADLEAEEKRHVCDKGVLARRAHEQQRDFDSALLAERGALVPKTSGTSPH